ncbi:MAG TPA: hypothetical protein ENN46_02400 [Candidatus Woesearchaeota archaeon]|mgnify:CR=1 FL=1|nr:hypothetical protein [Candidatus Woesearchaeota archaeon]
MNCKALAFLSSLVLLAALASSFSHSLSVSPADKYIFYTDDMKTVEGFFTVHDGLEESNVIDISVSEEYRNLVWLEKSRLSFRPEDAKANVMFKVDLDKEIFTPGEHEVRFSFLQTTLEPAPGISARLSVVSKLRIIVPFPDYFVELRSSKGQKSINLLAVSRGKLLTGCTVRLFSDGVLLDSSKEFSLVSQETVIFDFDKPPDTYNVNFYLDCEEKSFNHSTTVTIESFPYETEVSAQEFNPSQGYAVLSLLMHNPSRTYQPYREIFYDVFMLENKLKSGSLFVAPLASGAFDSVSIQLEDFWPEEETPELRIGLRAVIDNQVVSSDYTVMLVPAKERFFSFNFVFLFLFAFVLATAFIILKFRKVYKEVL